MKDRKDEFTPDLFLPPRRGRPLSPSPASPASRQEAYSSRQTVRGKQYIACFLPVELVAHIRVLAQSQGISHSAVIEQLLNQILATATHS